MTDVLTSFPEIDDIDDPDLRTSVRDCWATACENNDIEALSELPWYPPVQTDLGIEDERLVDHVRDVVAAAQALAESLERSRNEEIDHDLLLAGALVHDVSKPYEFDGMDTTPVHDALGHPYYGVHCVTQAGLPIEYAHIVLSHSSRTTVEPAFLEAAVIKHADQIAASAIRRTTQSEQFDP